MVINKTGVTGFEIPLGFKTVNATPIEVWSGPYSGDTLNEAKQIALSVIPVGVRYLTMQVRFVSKDKGTSVYWFKNGTADDDLVIYEPNSDAVETLYNLITGETNERVNYDHYLFNLITGETASRIDNDNNLFISITGESAARIDKDNELFNLITGETSNRISGYTELYNILTGQTQILINEEIFNRTTGDTYLYNLITGETQNRINDDIVLYDLITGETLSRINEDNLVLNLSTGYTYQVQTGLTELINNLSNIKLDVTGGTISGNLFVTGGTISGDGVGIYNILISGVTGLQNVLDNKSNIDHKHYQLYQPDGTNPFVFTDNDGKLHVNGDIIQSGSTYEIHVNKVFTTADTITLRDGATTGLGSGNYTGIIAKLYDGVNDGVLVFDKNGVARVGDMDISVWTGITQAIATREDSPINGGLAIWNSGINRFNTIDPINLPISNSVYNLITGETFNRITGDTLLNSLITGETKNRIDYDILLHDLITGETFNRITGDTLLNSLITGLTNNIVNNYIPYTGSSKNVNLGNYNITANTLTSTVTGSTPAIKISNTTKINNLNADLLDNYHSDYFVNTGRTINVGPGLIGGGNLSSDITISHAETSSASDIIVTGNTNGDVIQNIEIKLDTYGHVIETTASTKNLDDRYFTEQEVISRFVELTGDTMTGLLTISGNGVYVDYIRFNTGATPTLVPGMRRWSQDAGTTEVMLAGGNVTLQDGHELVLRCYNSGLTSILNGTPVTITGTHGIYEVIEPAVASNHTNSKFVVNGVATEDILPGNIGYVTYFGRLHDLDLSRFNNGDEVYLSQTDPGKLVKYSELNISGRTCQIGTVINNSNTSGILRLDIVNEIKTSLNTLGELNTYTVNAISTGVFEFNEKGISVSSPTTFSVSPMKGWIVDNETNPVTPRVIYVSYPGVTGDTTPYRTTDTITYLLVDSNNQLVKQNFIPTPSQRREMIYLGKLGHADKTNITVAIQAVDSMISSLSQVRDMFIPIGIINSGVYPYFTSGLTLNNTSGTIYGLGINFPNSSKNPNSKSIPGSITGTTFQYRTQTGGTNTNVTQIDPTKYDNNGIITAIGSPAKQATNQRIYLLTDGSYRIQYGQKIYSDLNSAKLGISSENFNMFSAYKNDAILIGILSISSDCLNISDPLYAQLFLTSKFGEIGNGGGGTSSGAGTNATFQLVYNNSISEPEIVTNNVGKALTIRRGSDNSTDNLIEFQSNSGNVVANVDGLGNITGKTIAIFSTGNTPAISLNNTTKIDNLNADMLDNIHASGFTSIDKFNIHTGNTNVHLVPNFTTAGTNTKITYSSNGLVISGSPATYDTLISDSVTSVAVGGAQSGITASVWKNKTIIEVLDNILFPDILPTYTIPTILITSNLSGLFEIGSTISQNLSLTGTKNDGGVFTSLNITRNGNVVSVINNPIGNPATNIDPQFGFNDPNNPNLYYSLSYTDTVIVSGGTTTWVGHGNYLSGSTKQNNKGIYDIRPFLIRDINAPQASSTNFLSSAKTINGVYPYYFGKSLTKLLPSDVVNIIQAGGANSVLSTNSGEGSLSINYSANGEWIWFAIMNSVSTKNNWFENALNNGNIGGTTDLISSPTILQINSPNGYWSGISYKIYVAQKITTIGTCVIS